jgi:hypothetical protein
MDTSPNHGQPSPEGGFRADTRRILRWLQARYQDRVKQAEPDPQTLLEKAERDRAIIIGRAQEDVVRAITHKNHLEVHLREAEARATKAQTDAERLQYEAEAQRLRAQWEQACATCEQMKAAYRQLEEAHRRRIAESLALRAKWRNSQIEKSMREALREVEQWNGDAGNQEAQHRKMKQAHDEAYQRVLAMRQMALQMDEKLRVLHDRARIAKGRGLEREENELLREIEQFEALREDHRLALLQCEETWQTMHETYVQLREKLPPLSPEPVAPKPKSESQFMPLSRTEQAWLWGTVAFAVLIFVLLLLLV